MPLPEIKAGTTGKAQMDYSTAANTPPTDCDLCLPPGNCGFPPFGGAPGWLVSYEDETVAVPPETAEGDYFMSVRTTTSLGTCPNSAPCKHLLFHVIAADTPPEGPGPECPSCPS